MENCRSPAFNNATATHPEVVVLLDGNMPECLSVFPLHCSLRVRWGVYSHVGKQRELLLSETNSAWLLSGHVCLVGSQSEQCFSSD